MAQGRPRGRDARELRDGGHQLRIRQVVAHEGAQNRSDAVVRQLELRGVARQVGSSASYDLAAHSFTYKFSGAVATTQMETDSHGPQRAAVGWMAGV